MKKLIMMKGLPASGKTTLAKEMLKYSGYKRVNKDDLRAMLDDNKWSKSNEKFILKVRDEIITMALKNEQSIICDDTNLDPKHEERLKELAELCGAEFVIYSLTDISPEECIKRDLGRAKPVGDRVIWDMYNRYLKNPIHKKEYIPGLPEAIIVDIDGTLAIMKDRGPYEWSRVGKDEVNRPISTIILMLDTINRISEGCRRTEILIVSGRDGGCVLETTAWLEKNEIPYDHLFMRPEGNKEKDSIIKKRIYDEYINGKYNIAFVLDDRDQVVKMWREEGLTCLQVAEGNF